MWSDLEKYFQCSMEVLGGKIDFVLHSIGMSPNVRKKRPYDMFGLRYVIKTLIFRLFRFIK